MNIKLLYLVSRGSLKLNSVDFRVFFVIDFVYLFNLEDIRVLIKGIWNILISMLEGNVDFKMVIFVNIV